MASFKKRSILAVRQNSRPKTAHDDAEDEDEPSVMDTMQDIKLGQKMRQKKLGAEFTSDGPVTGTGTENKSKGKEKTEVAVSSSSIVSLGTTQFESRIDTGMTGAPIQNAAHEKIMEQYIAEQMGAKHSSSSSSSSSGGVQKPALTAEDELYRLPDEFKYVVPLQVGNDLGPPRSGVDDESAMVNMSVGIAEVALPIQFKLKNIEDTEMARRSLEEKRSARFRMKNGEPECIPTGSVAAKNAAEASARGVPDTVLATNRFWNARVHGTHQLPEKDKNDGKSSSSGGDGTSDVVEKRNEFHRNERGGQGKHEFHKSGSGTGGSGGGGFRKRGNDDAVVQAFKKRQKYL